MKLKTAVLVIGLASLPVANIGWAAGQCYSDRDCDNYKTTATCKSCLKKGGKGKGWKASDTATCKKSKNEC